MASKTKTYSKAIAEIEKIIEEIETDELNIDNLSKKIKKASELFELCNSKLHDTEQEVEKIIDSLN